MRYSQAMSKRAAKSTQAAPLILGAKAFAAISAVEGLQLNAASRQRLDALKAADLTPDERRTEVLRAYTGLTGE